MISGNTVSKTSNNGESNIVKYVGVASINIVAVNPDNETMRKYGWNIPEDAQEPVYATKIERNGKYINQSRIKFLVQFVNSEVRTIIPIIFFCNDEYEVTKDGSKCRIIDAYGRTAFASKEDIQSHRIPVYSNGAANISSDYKLCHRGENELVTFLFKYLNITPFSVYDKTKNAMVNSKNPGRLTIDDWKKICTGDISEIKEYVALQPDNCVKIILGVKTNDENKTFQTFLNSGYLSNGAFVNKDTGEYAGARKLIDKFMENNNNGNLIFDARPVHEWHETASVVTDHSSESFGTDKGEHEYEQESDCPF